MKPIRFILLLMSIVVASSVFAQSPQRFNYQAVARDGSGNPLSEKALGVRVSIIDGSASGTSLYSETFSPTTSKQGLFSIQVGGGTSVSGAFSSIVWNASPKFLKVEIDPAGGSSFVLLGTSQLLSVPYAFSADRLVTPLSISDLSNVSDAVPTENQVLTWDGTQWTPGTGSGSIVTSDEFTGAGTSGDPLKLAAQGASSGQVLQWSGTNWAPATISGGVGDNWGTQTVSTSTALSGSGTSASPLTIAQQGATNGQVLKWTGTAWTPGNEAAGDNWGTAKVNTTSLFEGDGTPGNPLKLSGTIAAAGQSLMWNGTAWVPQFLTGTIDFPYSQTNNVATTMFQLQNAGGNVIRGLATSNGAGTIAVDGTISNSAAGAESVGVYGRNLSTNSNGYGIYGFHAGTGVGIKGEAAGTGTGISGQAGNGGVGIFGGASGAAGVGMVGVGATGVIGTSNTATGRGVYANATAGGYSGYFDGKTLIKSNSTTTDPNLYVWEDDVNDKTRVRFNNGVTNKFWDIGARTTSSAGTDLDKFTVTHFTNGDILTVQGDKKVGINVSNPAADLDVNGAIKVSGNIIANSAAGTNGQVLQSDGTKVVWGYGTIGLYNNTLLADQVASMNNVVTEVAPDGLNNLSFTTTKASKVSFTFSHSQLVSNGTGDVDLQVEIGFKDMSNGNIINRVICDDVIMNNKKKTFSYTHHCGFGGAGNFKPYVLLRSTNGKGFNVVGGGSNGQVSIFIVQQ